MWENFTIFTFLFFHRSPPYYVADTMNSSLDVPYLEHNLSNTSIGPVYHPHPNPGIHSWHHNPQDMTMVSVSLLDNAPHYVVRCIIQ